MLESAIKIGVRHNILMPIVTRPKAIPSIVRWSSRLAITKYMGVRLDIYRIIIVSYTDELCS
jgi:hypothetical protein